MQAAHCTGTTLDDLPRAGWTARDYVGVVGAHESAQLLRVEVAGEQHDMAGMQGSQIGDEGVELVAARAQDQASSGAEEAGDAVDLFGQRRVRSASDLPR